MLKVKYTVKRFNKAALTIVLLALVVSFLPMNVGFAETGVNDNTPREYWGRMLWANLTDAQVNSSFPFVYLGSTTLTDVSQEELLNGATLYMQTNNVTYLEGPESVCQWLDSHSEKKHLWMAYNTTSKEWNNEIGGSTAAYAVQRLAAYVSLKSEWRPLLQEVVDEFIRIFVPLNSSRIVFYVNGTDHVQDKTCWAAYQSHAIQALAIAAKTLSNTTVRNIAYSMAMNYTLGGVNLPFHGINQNGTYYASEYCCKEDETFGNYLYSMLVLHYYYPTLPYLKDRIYNVAYASQYM